MSRPTANSSECPSWEFGILGPLEVRRDGVTVPVGGPRQRALLTLLLCHANRVVPRDQLCDVLGDHQSRDPDAVLRVQISRLRKILDTHGSPQRLVTQPPGYLLRVDEGGLDLQAFERLVDQGRHAIAECQLESAVDSLRQAESLWRGRPLAELDGRTDGQIEVHRLGELRIAAVEDRLEAELGLGRHVAACAELHHLVSRHPLRERLRLLLMLALYRSGRQADALAMYREGRAVLVGELGIEPSEELHRLQQSILDHDPDLDLPTTGSSGARDRVLDPADPAGAAALGRGRSRRRSLVPVAIAVVVVVVGSLAVIARDHDDEPSTSAAAASSVTGPSLVLLDRASGAVKATVSLQAPPAAVAADAGSLWVAEPGTGTVARVDPDRHTVVAVIPMGRRPNLIASAAGRIWVADDIDRTVSRIDPRTDTIVQTVALGFSPSGMAADATGAWVLRPDDGAVVRIDPRTGRTRVLARTGAGARSLALQGDTIWVANQTTGVVEELEGRNGAVISRIRVGDSPAQLAVGPHAVWVLDPLDASAYLIDPTDGSAGAAIPLGGDPDDLAVDGDTMWVADREGSLTRVNTDGSQDTVRLGGRLLAVSTRYGLWVAGVPATNAHRGGILTTLRSSATLDTLDPAASTSVDLAPPRFFGMTNDGLVTLDHVSGSNGTRLVPDLATELPLPSHHGRTYLFHLRPGLRYSTGVLVKPADVRHSFERLFLLGSAGAATFDLIRGAQRCAPAHSPCDLSRGIVADNRRGTVTFRLRRPDPDFLDKLTLTYADVLPSSTPRHEATQPLPATGPYRLASYAPGHQARLIRNPYFREWSAAAQPDGYPDEIVVRLGVGPAAVAPSIRQGTADFADDFGGSIPADTLHSGRLRVHPLLGTGYLFLNVHAPPFDDLRVRRALNYAFDRRLVVDAYGGPRTAVPTCQVLPPGMPGYRPYCPYTRDATAGDYTGPDLETARRLVAASHTRGMKVTVWDVASPGNDAGESREAVAALRRLGYAARLRLLPDSTFGTYTNDSRNHAQIIDGGWTADYPSPDNLLNKLTCSYFVPGNPVATSNASEFCRPRFDRRVARADTLQASDQVAAASALFERLDHRLTDLAIWVPTVTPNAGDLVSHRIGNYHYNPVWGTLIDQMWVH